jgi:hypothetical protein
MQVSVSLDPYIVGIGDPIHGHVDIKLHEKSNLAKYPQMQTILTPEKQTVPCFASVTISIVGKCFLEKNYFAEPNTGGLEVENVSGKVFAVNFVACKASTLPLPLVLLSKHSDRPERKLNSFKIQFEAQMDQEILPSYVGSAVKIVYFVVVLVLDSAGKSVKEINVPFTVIPKDSAVDVFNFPKDPVFVELEARLVEAVAEDSRFEGNRIELVDENVESVVNVPVVPYNSDDEDEDLGVSDEEKEDSVHSEVNLPQNEPNAMLISSKGSLVAKLLLPKTKLSCGDIVRGIVDFSESKICGYRLTVTLERKEDLPQITNSSLRAGKDHIKILAYSHHYTYHCEDISFTFSLPDPRFSPSSLACPNIKSDICKLFKSTKCILMKV